MNFWTENGRTDSTHSKTRKCQKKGNRSKHCFWHYFQLKLHLWGPHTLGEFLRKEKTWRNYFILDGGGIPNKWHALFQYIKIPSGTDFRRSFSPSSFQNYSILKGKSDFPKFRKKTPQKYYELDEPVYFLHSYCTSELYHFFTQSKSISVLIDGGSTIFIGYSVAILDLNTCSFQRKIDCQHNYMFMWTTPSILHANDTF